MTIKYYPVMDQVFFKETYKKYFVVNIHMKYNNNDKIILNFSDIGKFDIYKDHKKYKVSEKKSKKMLYDLIENNSITFKDQKYYFDFLEVEN